MKLTVVQLGVQTAMPLAGLLVSETQSSNHLVPRGGLRVAKGRARDCNRHPILSEGLVENS